MFNSFCVVLRERGTREDQGNKVDFINMSKHGKLSGASYRTTCKRHQGSQETEEWARLGEGGVV